jgi:hypothetical protein
VSAGDDADPGPHDVAATRSERILMRRSLLAVVGLLALSSVASAQEKVAQEKLPVEIGMDGSLERAFSTPGVTSLSLPVGRIRAGVYALPVLEFETSLAIGSVRSEGASASTITAGVGVLYHFSPVRTRAQPYLRPFFEWSKASGSVPGFSASGSATGYGVGLGTKLPLADRFAGRFEVAYGHSEDVSRLALLFGLSFFTR